MASSWFSLYSTFKRMLNVDPHEIYKHTVLTKAVILTLPPVEQTADTALSRVTSFRAEISTKVTFPCFAFVAAHADTVETRERLALPCQMEKNPFFTLFIPCTVIQLLELEPTKCTSVIIQFYKTFL